VKNYQKGSSLLFALIILAVMLFGTVSLYSSTVMASSNAGALSFKEKAKKVGDIGSIYAINFLDSLPDLEQDSNHYYSVQHKLFNDIPCSKTIKDIDCTSDDIDWGDSITIENSKMYFVIERLCSSNNIATSDLEYYCLVDTPDINIVITEKPEPNSSRNIFYRITIKVEGENNTISYTKLVTTKDI